MLRWSEVLNEQSLKSRICRTPTKNKSAADCSRTSFKDYPPSQRAQSFSIDQIVEKMQKSLEAMQSQ